MSVVAAVIVITNQVTGMVVGEGFVWRKAPPDVILVFASIFAAVAISTSQVAGVVVGERFL